MGDRRIFLILQSPIEDFSNVEPGFDLFWDSLRSIQEVEREHGSSDGR
jgi:hypothetical protein